MSKRFDQFDDGTPVFGDLIPFWDSVSSRPAKVDIENLLATSAQVLDNTSGFVLVNARVLFQLLATKVSVADIVDALNSSSVVAPLSAKQGKALNDGKQDKIIPVAGYNNNTGGEARANLDVNAFTGEAQTLATYINALITDLKAQNILSN